MYSFKSVQESGVNNGKLHFILLLAMLNLEKFMFLTVCLLTGSQKNYENFNQKCQRLRSLKGQKCEVKQQR